MSFLFKRFRRYMLTLSPSVRRRRKFSRRDRELLVSRVINLVRRPIDLLGQVLGLLSNWPGNLSSDNSVGIIPSTSKKCGRGSGSGAHD